MSNKICYKDFLCENFQRQSCNIITPDPPIQQLIEFGGIRTPNI